MTEPEPPQPVHYDAYGAAPYLQRPLPQTNGLAVTALILGILSAFSFALWGLITLANWGLLILFVILGLPAILGGLLALVFGLIAMSKIKKTGQRGRGMALAGVILGGGTVLIIFALILFAVITAII